jgi:class 3 adenylate cyclase/tetratricopeptide (TPR) repeat protein
MSRASKAEEFRSWLEAQDIGNLYELFSSNDIDFEVLRELSDADLKELGLSLGLRRRIQKLIREELVKESPTETTVLQPAPGRAERRQLTVMFVDLVDSTAMATRLDPEEMGEVIRAYQNAVAGEIARVEGHVAKFMGDGVLAYFGWPAAHEDEAERAIRAGLAIVKAVAALKVRGQKLAVRVGIATGLVVVGDLVGEGAAQEEAVVGDTPNLAARLQAFAQREQVLVSEQTWRLAEASFTFQDLGRQELKGISAPVRVLVALGERVSATRFEIRSGGQLGALFGREQELALLCELWGQAIAGEGQSVLLTGEAGIGKSRLTHALINAIEGQSRVLLRYQCSPHYRDSALWPVVQQLSFAAQFRPDDSPQSKLRKLERLLGLSAASTEAIGLLAQLLSIPAAPRFRIDMSPQLQRARTLSVLVDQLMGLASREPVLVIVEDAHWIDPSTLEMFQLALDRIAQSRVLILMTSRPDGEPDLASHPRVTRITLNRLGRAAVAAITNRIAAGRWLPPSVHEEIANRSDGVPLFVEELTKAVIELAGENELRRRSGQTTIPATLHDSLMARLDRVPEVKRVAQLAACIGREFDYRTLLTITRISASALEKALERLVKAELIFRRGSPPDAAYTFKHALVRDAAANSLLFSERRLIHAELAQTLSQVPGAPSELIAQHAEAAGLDEIATTHWLAAGDAATARYANVEAVSHLERALRLVLNHDSGDARDRRELDVLLALGVPQIAAHGYASESVEQTFSRARILCERFGDDENLFFVLRGLWNCVLDRADLQYSLEIADTLLRLASAKGDAQQLGLAQRALGTTRLNRGDFAGALESFSRAIAACENVDPRITLRSHGEAPALISRVYGGWVLCIQGRLGEGLSQGLEALDLARRSGHPLLTTFVAHICCNIMVTHRRPDECSQLSEEMLAIARDYRLVFWIAALSITRGWGRAGAGDHAGGIEQLRAGIASWKATGAILHLPTWNLYLGDALLLAGQPDEAHAVLDDALAIALENGDAIVLADLHRLRGRAFAEIARNADAEREFLHSRSVAREQGAGLFELRAACDLAEFFQRQGRSSEAANAIASVAPLLMSDEDTLDFQRARQLSRRLCD